MEYIIISIIGTIIAYIVLYFVIKIAVRDGIVEARRISDAVDSYDEEGNSISKIKCPSCNKEHDLDYPKCPYCKYQY